MDPAIRRTLIGSIACTVVPPLLGLGWTVLGMIRAFTTLGKEGITDPSVLAQAVGMSLTGTLVGLIAGSFGLVVTVIVLIIHFTDKPAKPFPQPPKPPH